MSVLTNIKNKIVQGYYMGKTSNLVQNINAVEKHKESWEKEWESLVGYFDKIKQGLEIIKHTRKQEFTDLQHRTIINKVVDIFESM